MFQPGRHLEVVDLVVDGERRAAERRRRRTGRARRSGASAATATSSVATSASALTTRVTVTPGRSRRRPARASTGSCSPKMRTGLTGRGSAPERRPISAGDDRLAADARERHVEAELVVGAGEPAAGDRLPVALDEHHLAQRRRVVAADGRPAAPLVARVDQRAAGARHRAPAPRVACTSRRS